MVYEARCLAKFIRVEYMLNYVLKWNSEISHFGEWKSKHSTAECHLTFMIKKLKSDQSVKMIM